MRSRARLTLRLFKDELGEPLDFQEVTGPSVDTVHQVIARGDGVTAIATASLVEADTPTPRGVLTEILCLTPGNPEAKRAVEAWSDQIIERLSAAGFRIVKDD